MFLVLGVLNANAESGEGLYSKSFGDSTHPALIFLHGGPGYNCANFELTTAPVLAKQGYFVVVFDQRGCGRSKNMAESLFTIDEAVADVLHIYQTYGLKQATLLGHSWGGTLAGFFAKRNPGMVDHIVLIGSPLSYQRTLKTILKRCGEVYSAKNDSVNLGYLTLIADMDTASLQYSSYLFYHAMSSGLYSPKNPSPESKVIYQQLAGNPDAKLMMNSELAPVQGLHTNEAYTLFDMSDVFASCKKQGVGLWGIYGEEDGLFDAVQLQGLRKIIGEDRFTVIPNASHNLFIDQQETFLAVLGNIVPAG